MKTTKAELIDRMDKLLNRKLIPLSPPLPMRPRVESEGGAPIHHARHLAIDMSESVEIKADKVDLLSDSNNSRNVQK